MGPDPSFATYRGSEALREAFDHLLHDLGENQWAEVRHGLGIASKAIAAFDNPHRSTVLIVDPQDLLAHTEDPAEWETVVVRDTTPPWAGSDVPVHQLWILASSHIRAHAEDTHAWLTVLVSGGQAGVVALRDTPKAEAKRTTERALRRILPEHARLVWVAGGAAVSTLLPGAPELSELRQAAPGRFVGAWYRQNRAALAALDDDVGVREQLLRTHLEGTRAYRKEIADLPDCFQERRIRARDSLEKEHVEPDWLSVLIVAGPGKAESGGAQKKSTTKKEMVGSLEQALRSNMVAKLTQSIYGKALRLPDSLNRIQVSAPTAQAGSPLEATFAAVGVAFAPCPAVVGFPAWPLDHATCEALVTAALRQSPVPAKALAEFATLLARNPKTRPAAALALHTLDAWVQTVWANVLQGCDQRLDSYRVTLDTWVGNLVTAIRHHEDACRTALDQIQKIRDSRRNLLDQLRNLGAA